MAFVADKKHSTLTETETNTRNFYHCTPAYNGGGAIRHLRSALDVRIPQAANFIQPQSQVELNPHSRMNAGLLSQLGT